MNWKQLVTVWCGIGLILFIAVATVLEPYRPDYSLFVFWTFLVILITVGLINTFRTKKAKLKRSKEMNLHKGFQRLVLTLSLIPVLIGFILTIVGLVEDDEEIFIPGILLALFGFGAIWIIYELVLYIIGGFTAKCCANCEREIGKLEEQFKFKEHMVCAECHKKLNENQKEGTS